MKTKDKINELNKRIKMLDSRLYVLEQQEWEYIVLKFIDEVTGYRWVLGKYYLKTNTYEKINKKDAPDLYNELIKYFDNFKELCKKIFEKGENEMKDEKNIEVTNLDELQKIIEEVSELSNKVKNNMFKLNVKMEEIKLWRPEYKEKEKSKIDILNEYMQGLDDHLFVEKDIGNFYLKFKDNNGSKWWLAEYNILNHKKIINEKGNCPVSLYDELMFYYKDFIEKVNELYEVEEK